LAGEDEEEDGELEKPDEEDEETKEEPEPEKQSTTEADTKTDVKTLRNHRICRCFLVWYGCYHSSMMCQQTVVSKQARLCTSSD
jgi:hypothetical protein